MDFCHLIELVRRLRLNEMARESVKGNKSIFFLTFSSIGSQFYEFRASDVRNGKSKYNILEYAVNLITLCVW